MRLVIVNIDKMIGHEYKRGRFLCTKALETDTAYRFQFADNDSKSLRFIWIEVNRNGRWDTQDQKWYYQLNYPGVGGGHYVSADYWQFPPNVQKTFDSIFKEMV